MRKIPLIIITFILFQLASNNTLHAQSEEFLDQLVISARGYQTPLEDVPGGVEVATEEDLSDSSQHGSIAYALDKLPGISRTGESPYAQDISIRGLSGTSIVILVDGKRINTATDINARLGYISPLDIERVEVLKGPITALYGSGSLGGVINIITRKPTEFTPQLEIHGRVSLNGSSNPIGYSLYSYLEVSSERIRGQISVGFRDYNSIYGSNSQRVDNSQFRDHFGRFSLTFKASDSLLFTTEAMKSILTNAGIPGGNNSMPQNARITYPRGEFMMISQKMELSLSGVLKKIEAEVYYTTNRRRVRIDQIGPQAPVQPIELWPQADHSTLGGKLSFTFETERNTLVSGADFWTWDLNSTRRRTVRVGTNYITTIDKPTPKSKQLSIGVFFSDTFYVTHNTTFYFGGRLDRLSTTNEDFFFVRSKCKKYESKFTQEKG
jgi:hemoglobin/transferrin/lactoferrin receptor protein